MTGRMGEDQEGMLMVDRCGFIAEIYPLQVKPMLRSAFVFMYTWAMKISISYQVKKKINYNLFYLPSQSGNT